MYFRNAGSQCRNTACHKGTNGDKCLVFGVVRLRLDRLRVADKWQDKKCLPATSAFLRIS
jgi:hypothetical protein